MRGSKESLCATESEHLKFLFWGLGPQEVSGCLSSTSL